MAEQYVGPSAMRVANLLPHRVSFERGWFWTTTAICHGGKSDGLAFRQRPDGNGIEVKCHTGGCSAGVVITELEALIGLPIWTAYAQVNDTPVKAPGQAAVVEAQAGRRGRGGRLGRCGAAADARRGALLPEPRRIGYRGAAASAVHAPASGRKSPSPLTAGPPAPSYPSQHARAVSHPGAAFLLCPQAGANGKATNHRHLGGAR